MKRYAIYSGAALHTSAFTPLQSSAIFYIMNRVSKTSVCERILVQKYLLSDFCIVHFETSAQSLLHII